MGSELSAPLGSQPTGWPGRPLRNWGEVTTRGMTGRFILGGALHRHASGPIVRSAMTGRQRRVARWITARLSADLSACGNGALAWHARADWPDLGGFPAGLSAALNPWLTGCWWPRRPLARYDASGLGWAAVAGAC